MNKIKAFWGSLPHELQTAVIIGLSAAGETLEHVIEMGHFPSDWPGVKHLIGRTIAAGLIAAWAFYRKPNLNQAPQPPALPPDVPKAA